MKKAVIFIVAAVLMTAAGCEKKPKPTPEIPPQEDNELDKPFLTLAADDFTDIDVRLTLVDGQPPFEMDIVDFTGADLGSRLSPCKEIEYRNSYQFPEQDEGSDIYAGICKHETEGIVRASSMCGDKLYLLVDYDDLCGPFRSYGDTHCFSVYSYDIPTGETEELYSYSEPEEEMLVKGIAYADGAVYTISSRLIDVDKGTGAGTYHSSLLEIRNGVISEAEAFPYYCSDVTAHGDKLYIQCSDEKGTFRTEYDINTHESTVVYTTARNSRESLVVETDWYSIDTGLRGQLIGSDEHRAYVMCTDYYGTYSKNTLYTYDIDTGTRYISDITQYNGEPTPYRNGIIAMASVPYWYYIEPELGAVFPLTASQVDSRLQYDGDILYLPSVENNVRTYIKYDEESRKWVDNTDPAEPAERKIYCLK
ncbi:MAG: PQQ-like beta-propeller repeat protein [Ruminococcus sp.]|nr:PQQ-like beta-propeller repeat protein [Ruminococcus sp.]